MSPWVECRQSNKQPCRLARNLLWSPWTSCGPTVPRSACWGSWDSIGFNAGCYASAGRINWRQKSTRLQPLAWIPAVHAILCLSGLWWRAKENPIISLRGRATQADFWYGVLLPQRLAGCTLAFTTIAPTVLLLSHRTMRATRMRPAHSSTYCLSLEWRKK